VTFTPASFSAAQKTAWFTPTAAPALSQASGWTSVQTTAATADTLINYLRGQFGFEERSPANSVLLYRTREHVLGDIINGKPVYVKVPPFNYTENNYTAFKAGLASRQGVVYVAANDGMLHAFNSDTGNEMWAYVPSFVLPNLKTLADDNYANAHQFFVDGSPVANDIWTGTAWKTVVVGGLNGGGKGYYALDVTNPSSPVVMWEFSDANLGYTYGNPVMGKLTDGSWVVVFTSGYNNTPVTGNTTADGVGRLFVVNALTGAVKFTVSTAVGTSASPSGLGKIAAWVDNSLTDNTLQRVYGGDMLGNLWRFDINDLILPAGKEATQLALLQVGTYQQPITTSPEVGLVNNIPVIYVGTGRYLGASDVNDQNQQSLYAIVDQLNATGLGNVRSETTCPLVQQTITVQGVNSRTTTTLPVDFASKCGWFLDFNPGNDSPGERVNVDPKLQLGVLAVATNIPEQSVCTVGGSSFLYFFDYTTGTFVATAAGGVAGTRVGNSIAVGLNTYRLPDGRVVTTVTTSDDKHPVTPNPSSPNFVNAGKRVMFRELTN
jgi:type IV pilus assembly protein PilY1